MRDATVKTLELEVKSGGMRTYAETVSRGFYGRHQGGLFGKHDNVRTCWEDRLTQRVLRGPVTTLSARASESGRGIRILDLGCGAGQGFELLTGILETSTDSESSPDAVLPPERIAAYHGLDLSQAMLEQARRNLARFPSATFRQSDLSKGLGATSDEQPYDLYYSSYGSLSHLEGDALENLLVEIAGHSRPGALVVLDLVGRLSPEWPAYWSVEDGRMLDYSMSYLYGEEERKNGNVERFPLRFWSGAELERLVANVSAAAGTPVDLAVRADRSVLVGRHVDTREYRCALPRLRSLVNRLLELDVRTPLEALRVPGFRPEGPSPEADAFLARYASAWTAVADHALARLDGAGPRIPEDADEPLAKALETVDCVIDAAASIDVGDSRANVIEPQLAYVLRRLEHEMQQGLGCGHGLLAVLQIGQAKSG